MHTLENVIQVLHEAGVPPLILRGNDRRMVVVSPQLVGRVMCSGFDGLGETTRAWINEQQIRDGFTQSGRGPWNNFGGEERLQFAPDGGPFGFFFPPGEPQLYSGHTFPKDVNQGAYHVIETATDVRSVTMQKPTRLTNYHGTVFDLEITRRVEVLDTCPFTLEAHGPVEFIGFESQSTARNVSAKPMRRATGGVALWSAAMFEVAPQMIVIMPMRPGDEQQLGPPVCTRYFQDVCTDGRMDDKYWQVGPDYVLIKADGKVQTMVEMWKQRSVGRLGAINLADNSLIIVEYGFYPALDYFANYWLPYDGDPFNGSTQSSFVLEDKDLGDMPSLFELEPCSPALFLAPNESFRHVNRTYHLRGDAAALARICKRWLNAPIEALQAFHVQTQKA